MEQLLADLTNHVKINKSLKGACKYLDKLDLNKVNLSKYENFGIQDLPKKFSFEKYRSVNYDLVLETRSKITYSQSS